MSTMKVEVWGGPRRCRCGEDQEGGGVVRTKKVEVW